MPLNRLNSLISNRVKNKTRRRRHTKWEEMEKWWKTVRDTVFGALEAGVLSERAHFEQGGGNRHHGVYEYSATLSKYKETHERVLLIFPREKPVLESEEIRGVLVQEKESQEEGGRLEWDLPEEENLPWYCVICEGTGQKAFERERSILTKLMKIKSTRKGESTSNDGTRADVDATDEATEVLN